MNEKDLKARLEAIWESPDTSMGGKFFVTEKGQVYHLKDDGLWQKLEPASFSDGGQEQLDASGEQHAEEASKDLRKFMLGRGKSILVEDEDGLEYVLWEDGSWSQLDGDEA